MKSSARWGIPLLLLTMIPMASCRVAQPPQRETAGLRIDVSKVKQKRGGLECRLRIWNDYDQDVTFGRGSVRLMYGEEREASLRPGRRTNEMTVTGRGNQDMRWLFEPGESLPAGSYEVEIRDFHIDGVPSGQTAVFEVNV